MIATTDSAPETEVPGSVLDLQGFGTAPEKAISCLGLISSVDSN